MSMRSVVLIHGFTGSPASFDELRRRLLARQAGLRFFSPALLGHGAPTLGGIRRFEQEVDRLASAIVQANFTGSHLCGYSLGARVALGLLARHAHRFSGATLIGVHPGLGSAAERAARVGSDERWCGVLRERGLAAFLAEWQAQPLFATQRELLDTVVNQQRRIRSAHAVDGLIRSLRVLGLGQMPDYRGALRSLPLRLRLVVGALDVKFTALAQEIGRASPRVELDLVAGVGHNVLLEAPGHVASILFRALAA
jgi:2-succinyl-6-hydroxy-2,4-cyclohexadiene-1-carboxylate synthase